MQKQLGFVKNYPHPPAPSPFYGEEEKMIATQSKPPSPQSGEGPGGEEKEEKFGSLPTVYLHLQKK